MCPTTFVRRNSLHVVCSYACTVALSDQKAARAAIAAERAAKKAAAADRRDTRQKLDALKPPKKVLKEAQDAFNAWVRARDARRPCISCGKGPSVAGSWDAGHYLTVGARPELRFNEDNVHRQCVRCNQHLHGNAILYRLGLIARRGLAAVEALEGPHPTAKLSTDDLREITRDYRTRTRQLLAANESTQEEGTAQ